MGDGRGAQRARWRCQGRRLVSGRAGAEQQGRYSADVLASASYDNTVRIWREDGDGEWVCVSVLESHEGTVWGLQWEPKPKGDAFPRLLTYSADTTIRIWTLREEKEDEEDGRSPAQTGFGRIPNTMRRSLREDWDCTDVLPSAHTRDIYSVSWSASGLVASTGSDGILAVYGEEDSASAPEPSAAPDAPVAESGTADGAPATGSRWRILTTVPNAHGPYEINHVTWSKRFDSGTEAKGIEEMLITTGDDGIIRPWQVIT